LAQAETNRDIRCRRCSALFASSVSVQPAKPVIEHRQQLNAFELPADIRRTCIGFVDPHSFTRACITRSLQTLGGDLEIVSFPSCEECHRSTRNQDLILYHARTAATSNDCLASLGMLRNKPPVVVLSDIESPDFLLNVVKEGACGFVPTASATPEVVLEIIRVVVAGGVLVFQARQPPVCETPQRANGNRLTATASITDQFTRRETEVLDRLKLGKSNKIIAYELNLSESTVKVHLASIMKKMKATNRTEVVCRAHDLELAGVQE
jgi:DNA-binding NarL/FixJ family response regulator